MLTVELIWIYVLITTYLVGYAVIKVITSLDCMHLQKGKNSKQYVPHYQESYIYAGIIANTIYAQLFSLAGGVGLVANLLLVTVCIFIAIYYRQELFAGALNMWRVLFSGRNGVYYILIMLIMAYGASHGIMHYDSDLYHAQAIHWIEDYGIVRGLGNLHVRLAYNSSAFPLSALYSMSFISGKSYHVMSGFFALLLAWQCLDLKNVVRRGHFILSDFARIMAIYYLFTIFDEMVAPASDYFLSTIVFYIIIHWLDMNVRHEHSYVPYIFLALAGVYAITIKLSAAPMIILAIIPIYKLLHGKNAAKIKAFWVSVLLAFIISVPYFIRNVIISGWLIYPVTIFDFFTASWKIPRGVAEYDAKEIKTFGRGYTDVAAYGDVPFKEWVVNWFNSIHGLNKIMLVLDIVAIILYLACLIYFAAVAVGANSKLKNKLQDSKVFMLSQRSMVRNADFLTLGGTMILCLIFWLFSAPLIRYGEVYVCLTFAIVFGRFLILAFNKFGNDKKPAVYAFRAMIAILALWLVYKCGYLIMDDIKRFNPLYIADQQDYGEYAVESFDVQGTTIYYPVEGDRVGYYPFPAATNNISDKIAFMGSKIEEGIISTGK